MQRRRRVPSPSPKITGGGGGGGCGGGGAEESASLKHTRRARFSGEKIFHFHFSRGASRSSTEEPRQRVVAARRDARALPHLASKNALAERQPKHGPRGSHRDPNCEPETHLRDVFVDDFVSSHDDADGVFFPAGRRRRRRRRKVVRARAPDEREAEKT